ncbi:MAG: SdpI family protein [Usitatibacter sp.]
MKDWYWFWIWPAFSTQWLIGLCLFTALISVPLALRLVPPNPFYGFKTSYTRSHPSVWYDANAFVGRGMLFVSLLSAALLACYPGREVWTEVVIVTIPLFAVTIAGLVYVRHLRETLERR